MATKKRLHQTFDEVQEALDKVDENTRAIAGKADSEKVDENLSNLEIIDLLGFDND